MYEHQTFEAILERMLDRVQDNVDKREGSVIYDSLAPAAAELAQLYMDMDIRYTLSFADTADGEDLARRTAEFGVNRYPATTAKREGLFYGSDGLPFDVPLGSRFGIEELNFTVVDRMGAGRFSLECATPGVVGNQTFGTLLPIDHVPGLSRAVLGDVLVPGQDEELDEALRQRYYATVNEPSFGGNVADYKRKINGIDGVGGTKVFPVWQGGGTVKCTIIASDWNEPSTELVDEVQTTVDPEVNGGTGMGIAPIGHRVTVAGVSEVTVNVETTVTLSAGMTVGHVQDDIATIIGAYLLELRNSWADAEQISVRIAQIDARILNVPGVEDVTGTSLNGTSSNMTLESEQIPKLGTVVVHG